MWATVDASYQAQLNRPEERFFVLPDATRWNKLALAHLLFKITLLIIRQQPDVIITTGAAPGYFALVIGRLLRKKTCWIDSIANAEEMSLSGKKAGKWASLWITQWEDVASEQGPSYFGSVLSNLLVTTRSGHTDSAPATRREAEQIQT